MQIIQSGAWLYDNTVEKPVDIIGLTFDFWYDLALADDVLDPGEEPEPLGADGMLYYVRFQLAGSQSMPTAVDSVGHPTVAQAKSVADEKVGSSIVWFECRVEPRLPRGQLDFKR